MLTNDNFFDMWNTITELGIATDDELGLVTALNGRNICVLQDVLYIRTGYRNLEQLLDEDE